MIGGMHKNCGTNVLAASCGGPRSIHSPRRFLPAMFQFENRRIQIPRQGRLLCAFQRRSAARKACDVWNQVCLQAHRRRPSGAETLVQPCRWLSRCLVVFAASSRDADTSYEPWRYIVFISSSQVCMYIPVEKKQLEAVKSTLHVIASFIQVENVGFLKDKPKALHAFRVVTKGHIYLLSAKSMALKKDWVRVSSVHCQDVTVLKGGREKICVGRVVHLYTLLSKKWMAFHSCFFFFATAPRVVGESSYWSCAYGEESERPSTRDP